MNRIQWNALIAMTFLFMLSDSSFGQSPPNPCHGPYRRGDVNHDDKADMSDAISMLNNLYTARPLPDVCLEEADANGDKKYDMTDPIYIMNWLYKGGPAPKPNLFGPGIDDKPDLAFDGIKSSADPLTLEVPSTITVIDFGHPEDKQGEFDIAHCEAEAIPVINGQELSPMDLKTADWPDPSETPGAIMTVPRQTGANLLQNPFVFILGPEYGIQPGISYKVNVTCNDRAGQSDSVSLSMTGKSSPNGPGGVAPKLNCPLPAICCLDVSEPLDSPRTMCVNLSPGEITNIKKCDEINAKVRTVGQWVEVDPSVCGEVPGGNAAGGGAPAPQPSPAPSPDPSPQSYPYPNNTPAACYGSKMTMTLKHKRTDSAPDGFRLLKWKDYFEYEGGAGDTLVKAAHPYPVLGHTEAVTHPMNGKREFVITYGFLIQTDLEKGSDPRACISYQFVQSDDSGTELVDIKNDGNAKPMYVQQSPKIYAKDSEGKPVQISYNEDEIKSKTTLKQLEDQGRLPDPPNFISSYVGYKVTDPGNGQKYVVGSEKVCDYGGSIWCPDDYLKDRTAVYSATTVDMRKALTDKIVWYDTPYRYFLSESLNHPTVPTAWTLIPGWISKQNKFIHVVEDSQPRPDGYLYRWVCHSDMIVKKESNPTTLIRSEGKMNACDCWQEKKKGDEAWKEVENTKKSCL